METPEQWKERIRSVGFVSKYKPGATKRKPVENEERGGTAGYHVEHYGGRQDAVAQPRAIKLKMRGDDE